MTTDDLIAITAATRVDSKIALGGTAPRLDSDAAVAAADKIAKRAMRLVQERAAATPRVVADN